MIGRSIADYITLRIYFFGALLYRPRARKNCCASLPPIGYHVWTLLYDTVVFIYLIVCSIGGLICILFDSVTVSPLQPASPLQWLPSPNRGHTKNREKKKTTELPTLHNMQEINKYRLLLVWISRKLALACVCLAPVNHPSVVACHGHVLYLFRAAMRWPRRKRNSGESSSGKHGGVRKQVHTGELPPTFERPLSNCLQHRRKQIRHILGAVCHPGQKRLATEIRAVSIERLFLHET